jgi:hypothetical protein
MIWSLLLILAPLCTRAEPLDARFAVQAFGVKVGELVLTGAIEARRYTAASQFRTTGLAGAVARVRFILQAGGNRNGARFRPTLYREEMNTGRRESQVDLRFDGVAPAALSGGTVGGDDLRGAVDPLTAILMVLRDRDDRPLCALRQRVFDGERLAELHLFTEDVEADEVICIGTYRRLAGYPEAELRQRREFPLRIHYRAMDGRMRATRIRVETIYGPAVLLRR